MPEQIDAKQVLTYLNYLGFKNINAQQLKEFIKDLKRLMKYEEDLKDSTVESSSTYQNNEISSSFSDHSRSIKSSSASSESDECYDIFNNLYEQHTIASNLKKTAKKESVISVQIKKPQHKNLGHGHCVCCNNNNNHNKQQVVESCTKIDSDLKYNSCVSDCSKLDLINKRPNLLCPEGLVSNAGNVKINNLKPKVSFIRPRFAKNSLKTDPVSLYHFYQNEWKKVKFPGKDNHSDLRWAIRERMLGDPKLLRPYSSIEKIGRKKNSYV